jgi:hypothetical protein
MPWTNSAAVDIAKMERDHKAHKDGRWLEWTEVVKMLCELCGERI